MANDHLAMLVQYKAWANAIACDSLEAIDWDEVVKPRPTTFGNMLMTLNHMVVVDDIFRHHLERREHGYRTRNTDIAPAWDDLRARVSEMDAWYIDEVSRWDEADRDQEIAFEFVGGGNGVMTRAEIVLHLVNHSTYHRGFLGDMLKQVPYFWPANDLTVFLRDVWPSRTRE